MTNSQGYKLLQLIEQRTDCVANICKLSYVQYNTTKKKKVMYKYTEEGPSDTQVPQNHIPEETDELKEIDQP